ncbi:MAG: TRAP transporter large permease subunit, partial [Pseudomonadota bacterium]|nr:TRAP transporter large permease subunit [Pseudomonadota bacterium]
AALARRMTPTIFLACLLDTVKTSAMIFTILIGAIMFNNFLVLSAVPDALGEWIENLPLGPHGILIIILLIYLVLGCALDSLAMILLTIPIFFPVVQNLGFDPVWFGILIVMVVELGLISPPIGMNVFIIKGMAPEAPLGAIYVGVLPFVVAEILLIAILVLLPELALWLPGTMG